MKQMREEEREKAVVEFRLTFHGSLYWLKPDNTVVSTLWISTSSLYFTNPEVHNTGPMEKKVYFSNGSNNFTRNDTNKRHLCNPQFVDWYVSKLVGIISKIP